MTADPQLEAFLARVETECAGLPRPLAGLEMFSRTGDWITHRLAALTDSMECWEINPDYLPALAQNLPGARVRQVDSILEAGRASDRFGLISLDNPQGLFGPYCEHFEALAGAARLAAREAVVVFPVNIHPYLSKPRAANDDYGMVSHEEWFARRDAFYGRDARRLDTDFIADFYPRTFAAGGLRTLGFWAFLLRSEVPGHPDYFARCVARLSRD